MAKNKNGSDTTDVTQTEEERLAAEQAEQERLAAEAAEKAEQERLAAEQEEQERLAAEAAAKAEQDRLDNEEIARLEAEEAAKKAAAKAEQVAKEAAELAELVDDSGELAFDTLPEDQLSVHCKAIKDYVDIVSKAIPSDEELMRLNSRLRDNLYGILDNPDGNFAAMQLRTVVNMLALAPRYVFDTSLTFQFLNKFRWKRDMRREYECLLNTLSKMRYWKTQADADAYAWETFKVTMRTEKSEAYTRIVFASMGLEA